MATPEEYHPLLPEGVGDHHAGPLASAEVEEILAQKPVGARRYLRLFGWESKLLWILSGSSIVVSICNYMLSFVTLSFAGHLSALELAGASIAMVGAQGLSYGIMQQIRQVPIGPNEDLQFAFWSNRNNRCFPNPDGSLTWRKEYHTMFLSTFPEAPSIEIQNENYLVMTQTMCSLNGLTPADVPSSLLHYESANWKFNDTYPEEWRQNIRYLLEQYYLTEDYSGSSGSDKPE